MKRGSFSSFLNILEMIKKARADSTMHIAVILIILIIDSITTSPFNFVFK